MSAGLPDPQKYDKFTHKTLQVQFVCRIINLVPHNQSGSIIAAGRGVGTTPRPVRVIRPLSTTIEIALQSYYIRFPALFHGGKWKIGHASHWLRCQGGVGFMSGTAFTFPAGTSGGSVVPAPSRHTGKTNPRNS